MAKRSVNFNRGDRAKNMAPDAIAKTLKWLLPNDVDKQKATANKIFEQDSEKEKSAQS